MLMIRFCLHKTSDVVLKTRLGLKTIFFEVLVLTKAVLVLDGLKDLKNCGPKTFF